MHKDAENREIQPYSSAGTRASTDERHTIQFARLSSRCAAHDVACFWTDRRKSGKEKGRRQYIPTAAVVGHDPGGRVQDSR
jgi:hypothetical protein